MEFHYGWWILALGLGIAELLSGTLFMLIVAAGCAAGGAAAFLGAPFWAQCVTTALVSLVGLMWVRRNRSLQAPSMPVGQNRDVHSDVGASVQVDAWSEDGRARVNYRGTQWDAVLAPGESAQAGRHSIHAIDGNLLVLSRR
jgi:membrane protein implicated in regulation of membrane protease activity